MTRIGYETYFPSGPCTVGLVLVLRIFASYHSRY
jgi:hypothetical protein